MIGERGQAERVGDSAVISVRATPLRITSVLLDASFLIGANGLFGTLLSVRPDPEGVQNDHIGFVMACYSVSWIFGAFLRPRVIRRLTIVGPSRRSRPMCLPWLWFTPCWSSPLLSVVRRLFCGPCMAALFKITESWSNVMTVNVVRSLVMSVCMAVTFGTLNAARYPRQS